MPYAQQSTQHVVLCTYVEFHMASHIQFMWNMEFHMEVHMESHMDVCFCGFSLGLRVALRGCRAGRGCLSLCGAALSACVDEGCLERL